MITNVYFVRYPHSRYTPEELSRPSLERGMFAFIKYEHTLRRRFIWAINGLMNTVFRKRE